MKPLSALISLFVGRSVDHSQLEATVEKVISEFFYSPIVARPCFVGGLGATAGDWLIEILNWVRENWEIYTGVVAALFGGVYFNGWLPESESA